MARIYLGDAKPPPPKSKVLANIVARMPSVQREQDRGLVWSGPEEGGQRAIIESAARRYCMSVTSVLKVAKGLLQNPEIEEARQCAEQDLNRCLALIADGGFPEWVWVHQNCQRWIEYWAQYEPDPELRERFRLSAIEGQKQTETIMEAMMKRIERA